MWWSTRRTCRACTTVGNDERFIIIAETTYSILSSHARYLENPSYRHVYDIDPRLVELILLPRGYDAAAAVCARGLVSNENDMSAQFCGIPTPTVLLA